MKKKPGISPEDAALFRNTVGPLRPMKNDRIKPHREKPRPVPRLAELRQTSDIPDQLSDTYSPTPVTAMDILEYCQPGVQPDTMKKLRRGAFRIQAELDLHGMTIPLARAELSGFLHSCKLTDTRCVRIIHGKGLRSRTDQPVLKSMVNHWLREHNAVMAFTSAPASDGGAGAVYVLLKRPA